MRDFLEWNNAWEEGEIWKCVTETISRRRRPKKGLWSHVFAYRMQMLIKIKLVFGEAFLRFAGSRLPFPPPLRS